MKYLDAKKRLMFMLATCKYIKLIFKKDTVITDDDIKILVEKSIPLIFPEYTITAEDKTQIIEGIKSYVVKLENINISVNNSVTFEAIRRNTIHITELINTSELAKLVSIASSALHTAEEVVAVNSYNRLIASCLQDIKNTNESIILEDKISTLVQKSIPLVFESNRLTLEEKNILVENIKSILLGGKEKIKTITDGVLEVIRKDLIKVNSTITITDIVSLLNATSDLIYSNDHSYTKNDFSMIMDPVTTVRTDTTDKLMHYVDVVVNLSTKDKLGINNKFSLNDNLSLINTIKGITWLFKNELVTTKSEVILDLITSEISYIDIVEKLLINDIVNFEVGISNNFEISQKITHQDFAKLSAIIAHKIMTNDVSTLLDHHVFVALYTDLIKTNEVIFAANNINLNAVVSDLIKANDINKVTNDVVLTLGDFIALPFEINTKLNIVEKSFLYTIEAVLVSLGDTEINSDLIILRNSIAQHIKNISNLTIDTCLQILQYRYSKLLDWDPIDMDSVLDTNIINLIYVEK